MSERTRARTPERIALAGGLLAAAFAAGRGEDPMAASAAQLRDALRPALSSELAFPFDDPRRHEWEYHYVPDDWPGVRLGELLPAERARADALLASALSERGLAKVRGVLALQEHLQREAPLDADRDPGRYFLALFGLPGGREPWGWSLQGHHLALRFTLTPEGVAATPLFLGARPAELATGTAQGLRVLRAEEELARELLASLAPAQRRLAVRDTARPADLVFGPRTAVAPAGDEGIAAADLSEAQRELLRALLREYVGNLRADLAERELARIDAAGFDALRFLWIGPDTRGEPFYYRVHGPRIVVELDFVSRDHVHSVWRDVGGDFGADLLRSHRAAEHR